MSLINFYDNALIYYPNVFFAVLFFISILGIIFASLGIIVLWKEVKRVIEEIKSNLEQIKRIKIKKISLVAMVRIFLTRINKTLEYIESQAEKIVKKVEKEIFIKE